MIAGWAKLIRQVPSKKNSCFYSRLRVYGGCRGLDRFLSEDF
jgi:hypothetical protein